MPLNRGLHVAIAYCSVKQTLPFSIPELFVFIRTHLNVVFGCVISKSLEILLVLEILIEGPLKHNIFIRPLHIDILEGFENDTHSDVISK